MPTNHDDADDLLRGAMKVLDGEVPSGYFEALPNRTLARLEGNGMQTQSSGIDNVDDTNPVMMQDLGHDLAAGSESERAPTTLERDARDEDSGLHDIRSLASSTKARLSKRFTAPVVDEDVLASSSAGWKAVALPEPAKMVSLPEVSELPAMAEVKAAAAAASESRRSKRDSRRGIEMSPPVAAVTPAVDELAARREAAVATPAASFGSGMLAQHPASKKRGGLIAMASVGLAAAAGVAIYLSTAKQSNSALEETKAAAPAASAAGSTTASPIAQDEAKEAEPAAVAAVAPTAPAPEESAVATGAAADGAAVGGAAPAPSEDAAEGADAKRAAKPASKSASKKDKVEIDLSMKGKEPAPTKTKTEIKKPEGGASDAKSQGGSPSGAGKEEQQSLDDLLKEAGVNKDKKQDAPKLEKKSLSSDDIRKGMQSVASKAQACYAGTQGTASVKLTVAPTGKVQKAAVSGVFAGTPVGACVTAAVRSIQFPAWDGGPQSISYSYLLAE